MQNLRRLIIRLAIEWCSPSGRETESRTARADILPRPQTSAGGPCHASLPPLSPPTTPPPPKPSEFVPSKSPVSIMLVIPAVLDQANADGSWHARRTGLPPATLVELTASTAALGAPPPHILAASRRIAASASAGHHAARPAQMAASQVPEW